MLFIVWYVVIMWKNMHGLVQNDQTPCKFIKSTTMMSYSTTYHLWTCLRDTNLPQEFLKPKNMLDLLHWGKRRQHCRWYTGSQCHKAQSQGNRSHQAPVSMEGHGSHSKIHNLKETTAGNLQKTSDCVVLHDVYLTRPHGTAIVSFKMLITKINK